MGSEKRLEMLEKLAASGQADSFAWYGLALEYQSFGRLDEAFGAFAKLRSSDPDYLPMYLMCGTMLLGQTRISEGREWLESGLILARTRGDAHAAKELEEALEQVPPPPSLD
jgi:tetratricopeptide (TPR) repeat protein